MINVKRLFRRNGPAADLAATPDPIKAKWVARLSAQQAGHVVAAEQGYDQSVGEARSFRENGLVQEGDVVLDLGSGNGRQAIGLLDLGIARYVGVEPIESCVAFARRTFREYPQCEFLHLDLQNDTYNPAGAINPLELTLPLEDDTFDAAIAGSLFTHLGTIEVCRRYLRELHRVLKSDGRLFCSWFRSPPNELSSSHDRSVFTEAEIITLVTEFFTVYHSKGGTSDRYNDQWRLYCRKRALPPDSP